MGGGEGGYDTVHDCVAHKRSHKGAGRQACADKQGAAAVELVWVAGEARHRIAGLWRFWPLVVV